MTAGTNHRPALCHMTASINHNPVRKGEAEQGSGRGNSHHGAGVAALLAALPDQEGSVRLPQQQLLRLRPPQVAHEPALLVVMGQLLVLLAQTAAPAEDRQVSRERRGASPGRRRRDSLLRVVVPDSQPVVDEFLPDSFVTEPPADAEVAGSSRLSLEHVRGDGQLDSPQVLVPDLAELDEVGLQAVHLLVGLAHVQGLALQLLLQAQLALVDLTQP